MEEKFPICNREDCFANLDGKCVLLLDNDFGNRECPFYKTKKQAEAENEYYQRLADIRNFKENEE